MPPFDYFSKLAPGADPTQFFERGLARGDQKLAQIKAQQVAQQQADQRTAAFNAVLANPTDPRARTAYFLLNPQHQEAIKAAFDGLDKTAQQAELRHAAAVKGYLDIGDTKRAADTIRARIDADRAAGHDVADDEQLLSLVESGPPGLKQAAALANLTLAAATGEKFGDTLETVGTEARADALQPLTQEKLAAEIGLTREQANKANVEANLLPGQTEAEIALKNAQTANYGSAIEQRAFERDRLIAEGPPLPPAALTAINDRVAKATQSRGLAERANVLAEGLENTNLRGGGFPAAIRRGWNSTWGTVDPVVALRQQYDALMVSQAIANLPPGPASDKDVKMAMKGFPSGNADGAQMASFLRGVAKLQTIVAEREEAQADWMAGNGGNLGRAKRGFFVGNDFVEPGTTFGDYQRQVIGDLKRARALKAVQ